MNISLSRSQDRSWGRAAASQGMRVATEASGSCCPVVRPEGLTTVPSHRVDEAQGSLPGHGTLTLQMREKGPDLLGLSPRFMTKPGGTHR